VTNKTTTNQKLHIVGVLLDAVVHDRAPWLTLTWTGSRAWPDARTRTLTLEDGVHGGAPVRIKARTESHRVVNSKLLWERR
jgi:hypothetical protein